MTDARFLPHPPRSVGLVIGPHLAEAAPGGPDAHSIEGGNGDGDRRRYETRTHLALRRSITDTATKGPRAVWRAWEARGRTATGRGRTAVPWPADTRLLRQMSGASRCHFPAPGRRAVGCRSPWNFPGILVPGYRLAGGTVHADFGLQLILTTVARLGPAGKRAGTSVPQSCGGVKGKLATGAQYLIERPARQSARKVTRGLTRVGQFTRAAGGTTAGVSSGETARDRPGEPAGGKVPGEAKAPRVRRTRGTSSAPKSTPVQKCAGPAPDR